MKHTSQNGKIIVLSDLHYGLSRNSRNKLKILKEYVEPAVISELSSGNEEKTLIICGDLFHEMVSVRTDIYKEAKSFLVKCSELAHVILIAGNHDCYEDTTSVTSVELFEQLDNINVIRFTASEDIYGLKCLFLPWSDNNTNATSLKDNTYDCVFCHPDVPREFFSGLYTFENGRKMSATEKNKKILDDEILLKSGIKDLDFTDWTRNNNTVSNLESVRKVITLAKESGEIFAGHIHKHSESYVMNRRFRFIGSPYQTTSEEINTKSGYYIINHEGVTFKEIIVPEFIKIRFSDIKKQGVDNYDFSIVTNNIIQFDGDDIISVEMEAALRKKVADLKPFEISDTDYSNLVTETIKVENAEECSKALNSSPKHYVNTFLEGLTDDAFEGEGVSKQKIIENFSKLYDIVEKKLDVVESNGGANIKYKRLYAKNFLSYETLDFDFQKYNGLTLICGENLDNIGATNACGKSNIIKAIVYALFGQTPKKVKKENISPWWSNEKETSVTIELESNGVNYSIEFGKKGKDSSYYKVINLDTGVDVTKKQIKETRKFIEDEILHCNFDMFMKTTILTSSEIFNFYSMKKEDKEDYLNTIFGTKVLNTVRDVIKDHLKVMRGKYLERNTLLETKEHDIELTQSASERFEANRLTQINLQEKEIAELGLKIDDLKESSTPENNEILNRLSDEKNALETEMKNLNSLITKKHSEISKLNNEIVQNKTTVSYYQKEVLKHKDVIPKLCESCKKVVADGYGLGEYASKIKDSRTLIKNNENLIPVRKGELEGLENDRNVLIKKIVGIESEIKNNRSNTGEIYRLETMIESKKSMISYIKGQVNENLETIKLLEKDKSALEKEVSEIELNIRYLDFIQRKVVSQEVITNLLTSRFIKQLNERIRYYLQRLGLNLGVEFGDDFHYEFIRGDGAHPEFNSLSGGESLRIVIATSFAFKDFLESRRNIMSNIRFLDEFFEKDTDNLGMNSTITILKDFSRIMNQNVFLISNKLNEIDDSVFDNILVVKIKDSKSFIEEER